MDLNTRPGVFDEDDDEGPTESEWIVVGARRYKVFVVPSRLPKFVVEWCYGSFPGMIIGFFFFLIAVRRSKGSWDARAYSQKNSWFNGSYHREVEQGFPSISGAKAKSEEWIERLLEGDIPIA